MFTRIVTLQLKPNASREFFELFDKKILPILREQPGFKDEMLFIDPGGPEVVAVGLWQTKQNAEEYDRAVYPGILKAMMKVTDGTPKVRAFQLAYSSFHRIALGAAASNSTLTNPTPGVGG